MANKREKGLTLQITKENFDLILKGEQKVEHRHIWSNTMKRYITGTLELTEDPETGEEFCEAYVIPYDYLYLINGRKKDAPRLKVEVVDTELVTFTEEDGTDAVYEEDGKIYMVAQVWYHLGEVFETENIKE